MEASRDRRIGLDGIVVDIDSELLLDDTEQLDPLEGVEIEVGRQAGAPGDGADAQASDAGHEHVQRIGPRRRSCHDRRRAVSAGRLQGSGRRAAIALGEQRTQSLDDHEALDLEGVGPRQVLLGPDGPAPDLLVRPESGVGLANDGLGHERIVEQEDRMDTKPGTSRPTDDAGIGQARVERQCGFDILGVDLLPIRQGDHVLLAALEGQQPLGRQHAEVAGVVPAVVVDGGSGGLGCPPVAEEPVRATNDDLAIVEDAKFHAGHRLTDRAEPVALGPREADGRAHLGRAVTLEDVDAHRLPAPREVDVERGGADADGVQPSAEPPENGPEEEAAEDRRQGPGKPVEPLEGGPPSGLIDLTLDGVVEQAQALGHDQQHRDPVVAERPEQHGRLAADGIDDAGADQQWRDEAETLLEEVR
jgi:hypothetical protein